MPKVSSICPSEHCTAANPHHEHIGPTKAAQAGDPSLNGSYRCTYCNCVWRYDDNGRNKIILGHFNDALGANGWEPI